MERILEISLKHKQGHLGSCLTTFPILDKIYSEKSPNDIVVLSAGHGGVALYTALEKYEGQDADALFQKHGTHPSRDLGDGIHVSTGSLGSGILVATGLALGNKHRNVYVILSDGECAEGSVWEALAFAYKNKLWNLKVHVNINGWSGYDAVNKLYLWLRIKAFFWPAHAWFTSPPNFDYLTGLKAHYHVITESHKEEIVKYLNEEGVCGVSLERDGHKYKNIFNYGRSWVRCVGQYSARLSRALYKLRRK
jgi:transketolase